VGIASIGTPSLSLGNKPEILAHVAIKKHILCRHMSSSRGSDGPNERQTRALFDDYLLHSVSESILLTDLLHGVHFAKFQAYETRFDGF
jgi:hypothetical protein